MKVRITDTPRERELDGVELRKFVRGSVCNVSASIGTWLVAQGYALAEMRRETPSEEQQFSGIKAQPAVAHDRRRTDRRRSTDR